MASLTTNDEFSLIDKFPDALFIIDFDKNIIKVNSSACSITGYEEDELLQLKIDKIDPFNPNFKDSKFKEFFKKLNSNAITSKMNTMQLRKSGILYPAESSYFIMNDDDNPKMVIITQDKSNINTLEQYLVKEKNQRIRALFEGQEIERKRIAKEMHDSIGQLLASVKLSISALPDLTKKEQTKKIDSIDNLLGSIIEDVRRIYENLFPRVLQEFGLRISLENLCDQIQDITNIKINFEFVGKEREIEDQLANSIYRITQEAINNAMKYADATEIRVRLSYVTNNVELTVQDNGKGFDASTHDIMISHGLNNMKERSEVLNGTFEIQSVQKEGTSIRVNIPF